MLQSSRFIVVLIALLRLASTVSAEETNHEAKVIRNVETAVGRGGFGEIYLVHVVGVAVDQQGNPVAGARVFAVDTPDVGGVGHDPKPVETTSDDEGRFEIELEVLAARDPSAPMSQATVGEFCVYGIAEGFGFTWAPEIKFVGRRLEEAESDVSSPDYHIDHSPTVKLEFSPPAMFEGLVTDDRGEPISNALVQVGFTEGAPRRQGRGIWRCRYSTDPGNKYVPSVEFAAIRFLPTGLRETHTDEQGRFSLPELRNNTDYLTLVDPGPEFDAKTFTLLTVKRPEVTDARDTFFSGDGMYIGVFDRPREVRVNVAQGLGIPVAGARVLAHGRRARFAGADAVADEAGLAVLKLPPGEYRLLLEPPLGAPLLPQKASITVGREPNFERQFRLPEAARVILHAIDVKDGSPISGVRFKYQTEAMDKPRLLSSEQVVCDYRSTNSAGELEAILPPGEVRILTEDNPRGLTPEKSESELLQLVAGELTEVDFQFDRTVAIPDPAADSDKVAEMVAVIARQRELLGHAKGNITARRHFNSCDLNFDTMRASLDVVPPGTVPDIRAMYQEWTGNELRFADTRVTFDRARRKTEALPGDQEQSPGVDYMLFNGSEGAIYRAVNHQLTIQPQEQFRYYVESLYDFVSLPPPRFPAGGEMLGDQYVLVLVNESSKAEIVVDPKTGFLLRNSVLTDRGGEASWQFGETEYENGLRLPKLLIEATLRDGKVVRLEIAEVVSAEFVDQLPADAFAAPVPAGTVLVDYHGVPSDGPGRPATSSLTGPLTDACWHVQRTPSTIRSIEPKLHYGDPAPPVVTSQWFTAAGPADPADTNGKIMLLEFWATWCGPCIAQIEEMNEAAAEFADQPVAVLGIHASGSEMKDLTKFADGREINYPLAIDKPAADGGFGSTAAAFGVRSIPQTAVINRDGKVVYLGSLSEAIKKVRELVKE